MPNLNELKLIIHGYVQGVTFRWFTEEHAKDLGLVGFVKNLPDGTVAIVAQGEKNNLESLINYCKKGPEWAKVTHVEETWNKIKSTGYENFSIKFGMI